MITPLWLKDDTHHKKNVLGGVTPITCQAKHEHENDWTHCTHETMKWSQQEKCEKKRTANGNLYSKLGCDFTLCEVDFPQSRQQLRAQMLRNRAIIAVRVDINANQVDYTTIQGTWPEKSEFLKHRRSNKHATHMRGTLARKRWRNGAKPNE